MTAPDHGVDLLLRRATDDLRPDVDQLVAGGITRGRTRQRRARIGTAVAAVAVFGVIGAAAAVVPHGSAPDSARDPGFASDSPTPTPTRELTQAEVFPNGLDAGEAMTREQELWLVDSDNAPDQSMLRPLVSLDQMGTTLREATGGVLTLVDGSHDPGYDDQMRRFQLLVDGGLVTFMIRQYNPVALAQDGADPFGPGYVCRGSFPSPSDCAQLTDGSWLLRQDTFSTGGVGVPKTDVERDITFATVDGWQIDAAAYNTSEEKTGEQVTEEPVLTMAELEALATSPVWYQ